MLSQRKRRNRRKDLNQVSTLMTLMHGMEIAMKK
jgi:hypothetical protein